MLRGEIVTETHGEIVKKIRFFDDKEPEFVWAVLPLLKPMKVYKKDILYGQGDQSEEIFFIIHGRVKFYFNLTHGQKDTKAKNIPINLHVEGSYFGDSDVLLNKGRDGRNCTAIAETEC